MTAYGWMPIAEVLQEPNVRDLIRSYWEELSPLKRTVPLDPNFELMMQCEAAGTFRTWTARSDDGLLIGVVMLWIMPHLNYKSTLFAIDAGHYVHPEHRDTSEWIGVRMWRSMLEALPALGVRVILAHDNASRPLAPFFLRLGFEPRSTIYWKAL